MRPLSFNKYVEKNIHPSIRLRVVHMKDPVYDPDANVWRFHYNGITKAELYDRESGRLLAEGLASCKYDEHNDKFVDVPNKKIGRAIAVGRALKDYYQPSLDLIQRWRESDAS